MSFLISVLLAVLCAVLLWALLTKLFTLLTCGHADLTRRVDDKIVVITGGNAGIGFETALDLCKRGACVVIACRDVKRGEKAERDIRKAVSNAKVNFMPLDLFSFKSIERFVSAFASRYAKVDILINNAGIMQNDKLELTGDMMEQTLQANYFSPFYLTKLMIPLLEKSQQGRIINVGSMLYLAGKVNVSKLADLQNDISGKNPDVYSDSKLLLAMWTRQLARRLTGTGITANYVHPGLVKTKLVNSNSIIWNLFIWLAAKSPYQGAQTSIHLAIHPTGLSVSGGYFQDCWNLPWIRARDQAQNLELWNETERIIADRIAERS